MPEMTNGIARTSVATASPERSDGEKPRIPGIGIARFVKCEIGIASASARQAPGRSFDARSGAKRSPPTNTRTAPPAMPSMATDTAKNER